MERGDGNQTHFKMKRRAKKNFFKLTILENSWKLWTLLECWCAHFDDALNWNWFTVRVFPHRFTHNNSTKRIGSLFTSRLCCFWIFKAFDVCICFHFLWNAPSFSVHFDQLSTVNTATRTEQIHIARTHTHTYTLSFGVCVDFSRKRHHMFRGNEFNTPCKDYVCLLWTKQKKNKSWKYLELVVVCVRERIFFWCSGWSVNFALLIILSFITAYPYIIAFINHRRHISSVYFKCTNM